MHQGVKQIFGIAVGIAVDPLKWDSIGGNKQNFADAEMLGSSTLQSEPANDF